MVKLIHRLLRTKKKYNKTILKRATLADMELYGKTVLLRVDFNVPTHNGKVKDSFKIKKTLPTIKELLRKRCKVVIISHLGRPKGKPVPSLSLKPVASELARLLPKRTIHFLQHCIGRDVKERIKKANQGQIIILENLRFYSEEETRDLSFAHALASLAEVYIFDAFAVAHRKHATTTLLPAFLPTASGLLLQDEVDTYNAAMRIQKKSLWVIGGAKLDKLNIIPSALKHAELVFIGGALCFSFLRAKGIHVGHSKVSRESVDMAKKILSSKNANKIILPTDFVCSNSLKNAAKKFVVDQKEIPSNAIGLDIGPKSVKKLIELVHNSKQIIWNGPLGFTELSAYRKATVAFMKEITSSDARTICGGGETIELLKKYKKQNAITHISTGGGATLTLLGGKKLPALDAIGKSAKKFKLL